MKLIDKSFNDETLKELQRLQSNDVIRIEKKELNSMLNKLGYKLQYDFSYCNTSNSITYNAKSFSIVEIKSGHSFANVSADHTHIKKIQEIRRSYIFANTSRSPLWISEC